MSIEEKFEKDELKLTRITNDDLVCQDCKNRYDDRDQPWNTGKCKVFHLMKPAEVLSGGDCSDYKK